jgi:hypothetical protein
MMKINIVHEISLDEILTAAIQKDPVETLASMGACFQALFSQEVDGKFSTDISLDIKARCNTLRNCKVLTEQLMESYIRERQSHE